MSIPWERSFASNQGVVFWKAKQYTFGHGHLVGLKLLQSPATCAFIQLLVLAFVFIPTIPLWGIKQPRKTWSCRHKQLLARLLGSWTR